MGLIGLINYWQSIMFLGFVRPSLRPILVNVVSQERREGMSLNLARLKHPFVLRDELIRIW